MGPLSQKIWRLPAVWLATIPKCSNLEEKIKQNVPPSNVNIEQLWSDLKDKYMENGIGVQVVVSLPETL